MTETTLEGRHLILAAARDELARIGLQELAGDSDLRDLVKQVGLLARDLMPAEPGVPDPVFCGTCGDWRDPPHSH